MELLNPRGLKIANWVVLAILTAAGYLGGGREFALGVLVGGLLVVINFHLLHRFLKGILDGARAGGEAQGWAKAFFALKQIVRFLALVVVVYVLVSRGWVNVFGMLLGLSTVVLTLTLLGINEAIKLRNKEANPSHGTSHPLS